MNNHPEQMDEFADAGFDPVSLDDGTPRAVRPDQVSNAEIHAVDNGIKGETWAVLARLPDRRWIYATRKDTPSPFWGEEDDVQRIVYVSKRLANLLAHLRPEQVRHLTAEGRDLGWLLATAVEDYRELSAALKLPRLEIP